MRAGTPASKRASFRNRNRLISPIGLHFWQFSAKERHSHLDFPSFSSLNSRSSIFISENPYPEELAGNRILEHDSCGTWATGKIRLLCIWLSREDPILQWDHAPSSLSVHCERSHLKSFISSDSLKERNKQQQQQKPASGQFRDIVSQPFVFCFSDYCSL